MAGTILLEVATPERLMLKETVIEVEVPGANGELGILPEHAPLLSELGAGVLRYTVPGQRPRCVCVSGGWVEVGPNSVRILANTAELADDIDLKRAQDALQRANQRLLNPTGDVDIARALNALKRAQARLDASKFATGK
ncbi:MAG: F0F1 ATP synthase subunit epsilon [Bryobacteraceae bacterium]|nr:F0F1 ATP synthase subunit epsilon [Bryobacteraceae bacterium]